MKILKVSLKNLNSLRGAYEIDLENGPLSQAGIFAITGPTGAGKSTILDAITLGLYGRAARYGDEVPEDMMSRHTGECRAEVEFAVPTGRFRASWHLNRAHGKVGGRMQLAQRRVFDAHGTTLAQNKTQADAEIEKLTGLNYDRFLRSVLLAQGDFARFLKANADERADLLEQLTGTEIYTELSTRAHVETKRREDDLDLEVRAQAAIVLLTGEERAERAAAIARLAGELAAGQLAHEVVASRVALARQLRTKFAEIGGIGTREAALAERRKAAEADFQRLTRHRQAQPFCTGLARLDAAIVHAARETNASHRLAGRGPRRHANRRRRACRRPHAGRRGSGSAGTRADPVPGRRGHRRGPIGRRTGMGGTARRRTCPARCVAGHQRATRALD